MVARVDGAVDDQRRMHGVVVKENVPGAVGEDQEVARASLHGHRDRVCERIGQLDPLAGQ